MRGTLEILSDGFGYLRSPEANYLPGPDDIYVSPNLVRRYALRTGDTVEGPDPRAKRLANAISLSPKSEQVNFEPPDAVRHRINFDNLTPALSGPAVEDGNGEFPVGRERSAEGQHPACDRSRSRRSAWVSAL